MYILRNLEKKKCLDPKKHLWGLDGFGLQTLPFPTSFHKRLAPNWSSSSRARAKRAPNQGATSRRSFGKKSQAKVNWTAGRSRFNVLKKIPNFTDHDFGDQFWRWKKNIGAQNVTKIIKILKWWGSTWKSTKSQKTFERLPLFLDAKCSSISIAARDHERSPFQRQKD